MRYYSIAQRELYRGEYPPIHRNLSWVPCLITSLVACFSLAPVMALWWSIFQMRCTSERNHLFVSVVTWKQLITSSMCAFLASCRASVVKKELPPELDTKKKKKKKGSWSGSKGLRFITPPSLLMVRFAWLSNLLKFYSLSRLLNTWNYSWKIRRHKTLDLIVRPKPATFPVS